MEQTARPKDAEPAPPPEPSLANDAVYSILAIALPIFAALAIDWYARLFLPGDDVITALKITETIQLNEARLLAETPAQIQYAFASLLVIVAAFCGFLYAFFAAPRRLRPAVVAMCLLLGCAIFVSDETANAWLVGLKMFPVSQLAEQLISAKFSAGELMRLIAVDHVLERLNASDGAHKFAWLAAITATLGMIGVTALATNLAILAWPVTKGAGALRRRKQALQMTLAFSAAVMTLSVAANRAFYHWPASMLDETAAKAYGDMVSMASGYWGLVYTMALIAAVTPAVLSHRRDVYRMAERKAESKQKIGKWIDDENLRFAPRDGFGAALATAAPILTSPVLDLLTTGVV